MESRPEYRLLVPDMTCGHCVKTITRAVQQADPQARVRASTEKRQVSIDSAVDIAILEAAIRAAGYTPAAG